MSSPLSIGLIGIGGMGEAHFHALTSLEKEGAVRLVATAEAATEKFAEKIAKLQARGIHCYSNYEEMLACEKLDAVVIATPIFLHAEMARKCIERGVYVYLEKPPMPLIQQLNEMINLDKGNQVRLVFQMISSGFIQELKKWVVEGKLGEIQDIHISACWPRMDGYYNRTNWAGKMTIGASPVFDGPATNALAHLIHNAMYLAGDSLHEFSALDEIQAELYRVRPIESYDLICLRGKFPSGIKLVAALTHATEELRPFRLRIRGTKGWAEISKDGAVMESSFGKQTCAEPHPEAWRNSYHNFLATVHGQPSVPGTKLKDTRGYLTATNGALLSSGGISSVDKAYYRIYGTTGNRGYDVPGLTDLIDRVYSEGLLFSELGAPWAKPTPLIQIQSLSHLNIDEFVEPKAPLAAIKD